MDTIQEKTVSFKIDPFQLTQLARNVSIEKGWQKGVEFLAQALEGITYEDCTNILLGRSSLTGDGYAMDVTVDTSCEDMTTKWQDKTKNCFEYEGSYWRAYSYIDGCSKKDYDFAREELNNPEQTCANSLYRKAFESLVDFKAAISWRGHEELILLRNMYYAFNKGSDLVLPVKKGSFEYFVLFEKIALSVPPQINMNFSNLTLDWTLLTARGAEELIQPSPSKRSDVQEEIKENPLNSGDNSYLLSKLHDESNSIEYVEKKRQVILDYAKADAEYGLKMFRVRDRDTGQYVDLSVPYRAFLCLAYSRARLNHLMPEYSPFTPPGLKGHFMDSSYHTDAWLGAGGNLENAYDEDLILQRVFMWKLHELQMELTQFEFSILCKGCEPKIQGTVETNPEYASPDKILLVKNAAPEYAVAASNSAAVICEIGSKIAHLVIVSAEAGASVIRMDNATKIFKQGQEIEINLQSGEIRIL